MKKKAILFVSFIMLVSLVQAAGPTVNFEIKKRKTEPAPLRTSEYADVWLKVVNQGSMEAENANVTFIPSYPFETDPGEKTSWDLGTMYPGEEYRIHMQVKVDENAVHGTNYLNFKSYLPSSGVEVEEKVPVEIRTDDAALVVSNIDFPEKVGPGTSNSMGLSIKNLADSQLKNIDVSLGLASEELPFATRGTSMNRIEKIEPGESAETSFDISADQDAENGLYKIPITLEYEDEAGNQHTTEPITGLVVGGSSDLEVGVNQKDDLFPGSKGSVTLRITNQGDGRARFVSLKVPEGEGYEVLSTSEIYLGNMDSDDYQTAEFDLYVENGSDISLPAELHYRDDTGEKIEDTRHVDLQVYGQDEISKYNLQEGRSFLLIAGIIALALIGGIFYWKKR
ncbi:MAG: COG1361 S-layer family protein [Candidatus Nanohaloarchaeota archaeon QJJ-9]|nr:COG1361 S-layer family protein [Candidatus Nanohaloarchaeota archaeon QJJ-9]